MEFRFTDAKIQLPVEIGPELWQALEQQSNQFQQSGVLVEQLQLVLPLHRCDVALPEDDPDEVQTRRMATLPHMRPITVDVRIRRPDLLLQNLHVDRLTELFIENCDMFAEAQACAVLSRCVHLQQLLLSTTKAGRVVLHESFAPTLSTLKQLTELTLHVRLPAESYQQLPSTLQDLTLSFLPSKASISHITGLKGLALKAPACEPSTLLKNASLSHLEHLDIIYLNRNACAAEGHAAVWPALPALRELFLHWVDREQHALSPSIAAGIAASTQLTSLLIELTDVPASVDMVETLRPLWNLRRLFLSVMSPKASVSSFGNLFSEGLVSLTSLEFEWPSLPVKSLKQVSHQMFDIRTPD